MLPACIGHTLRLKMAFSHVARRCMREFPKATSNPDWSNMQALSRATLPAAAFTTDATRSHRTQCTPPTSSISTPSLGWVQPNAVASPAKWQRSSRGIVASALAAAVWVVRQGIRLPAATVNRHTFGRDASSSACRAACLPQVHRLRWVIYFLCFQ